MLMPRYNDVSDYDIEHTSETTSTKHGRLSGTGEMRWDI